MRDRGERGENRGTGREERGERRTVIREMPGKIGKWKQVRAERPEKRRDEKGEGDEVERL